MCQGRATCKVRSVRPISISTDVSQARLILVILLCASPILLFFDGPIVHGLLAGVAAAGMVMLSRTMRPGETAFFLSIARTAALIVAIPALWILIQVLPFGVLAHPIWASTSTAIGHPIRGAISIDIGESVMALGQYLAIVAIAFWSAAVAVDRQRAEWILFSLMAATALIGLAMATGALSEPTILSSGSGSLERMQGIDCIAMGVIIAAAATVRTLERYETRHASPGRSVAVLVATFAACATALAICVASLLLATRGGALVATGYGAAALASAVIIRRLGFGPWGTAAVAVLAIAVAALLVANDPELRTKSFSLAFASDDSPASLTSMSQRVLDDAPLAGTGAGTFAAIAPIYGDIAEQSLPSTAPTAAAAVAIELGRPTLWLIVATIIGAIAILFRAALQRGRDSFYPMAGAGCLITLLFLCFMNAGLMGTATAMIAAATIGLAFGQSKSRTVQQ